MEVIYGLIPAMIILGLIMVGVLFWAVKKGQYDDLEGEANRILMDDDDPMLPENAKLPENTKLPENAQVPQNTKLPQNTKQNGKHWPDAD